MKSQLAKFGSVGLLNTLIDFGLFGLLSGPVGLHYIAANIISTGVALTFSFTLHGQHTFRSRLTKKKAVTFLIVTLIGLWILQPIVIAGMHPALSALPNVLELENAQLLAAKIFATIVSTIWNYILYKYLVFSDIKPDNKR